jgi:MGT family glycosyltransferase
LCFYFWFFIYQFDDGQTVIFSKGLDAMSTYVFFSMPAYGHVNPTLAIVQELVLRGHKVSYYLTEEFRAVVQATGATFQPYTSQAKHNSVSPPSATIPKDGPPLGLLFLLEDKDTVPPQIIDRVRADQPDVIVYDFMCLWARAIIDELQIAAVITKPTYASNEHFSLMEQMRNSQQKMSATNEMGQRIKEMMAARGDSTEHPMKKLFGAFSSVEQLNIIFITKEFQPEAESFDERYLFVGPSILPRHQDSAFPFEQLKSDQPLLYISLGSIFNNQPEFYKQCFEAFAGQSIQVVMSIGKKTDPGAFGPTPENFLLAPYVPQLEILPRTQIFVTHAGTNSIMESMYFGVPMVLIPQQPEQQMHAQRVVELGLGVMLDKEQVNAGTLREAVERVSHDDAFLKRAHDTQQAVQRSGGYQRATDALIEFAQVQSAKHSVQ